MANIYDMIDTWNDGATTFTSIKMNVTDTASDAASLLMDLQVAGASKFSVDKSGNVLLTAGSEINAGANSRHVFSSTSQTFHAGGRSMTYDNTGQLSLTGGGNQSIFSSSIKLGDRTLTTSSAVLSGEAANTLGQRNGVNAQTFNLYNTYTDASNYERGGLTWNTITNALVLEPQKAGTGVNREMWVRGVAGSYVRFKTDNQIDVSGGGGVNIVLKNSTTELVDTPVIKAAKTVATLPVTPEVGMIARVTDASAPAVGSTVAGGGAANALCWYNGTNWTVIGV